MKKSRAFFGAGIFALLVGCGADKGTDFIGHWTEVNGKTDKPMTLDISYDGEVFHVYKKWNVVGMDRESKLDGKAESDSELSFISAKYMSGMTTMSLQNNNILFEGRKLSKSP